MRMAIIGDEDGGFARIAIRPSFPNLLYRLFADLQMPAHFRILFNLVPLRDNFDGEVFL